MAEIKNGIKNLLEFEKPLIPIFKKLEELKNVSAHGMDMTEEIKMLEKRIETLRREIFQNLSPIQIVQLARHILRPTALDYINLMIEDFVELRGDRNFGDDPALVGGVGRLNGKAVMVIGHQKGHTTKELLARNFGMANPEGYRKALRLMRIAQRANRPIISLVDTPGAYPGIGAEERGQSEAIAKNLREMAALTVPFVTVITGEGGSGGALGIGMGNRVLMLQYSIYSVISPEGCAAILWKDGEKGKKVAADSLKLTAHDLHRLGVIDEVIQEPMGGGHRDPQGMALSLKEAVERHLRELETLDTDKLLELRYEKFRKIKTFVEEEVQ